MGPMPQASLGGSKYILVFIDDYSRKGWVYFLKNKSETITKFCEFKTKIEGETGNRIQALRTDRGREYLSEEFSILCRTAGIQRELTQAHTPQQNGVSERRNRTIMERARSMSSDCNLPVNLWTEAVLHAQYLINRSPTRANSGATPEAKYSGKLPDISDLIFFGCVAFVHIPKENRKKLDSKTLKCMFLGFDSETKAYRLYDQTRQKVIISRDVVFDETKVGVRYLSYNEPTDEVQIPPSSELNSAPPEMVDLTKQPEFDSTPIYDSHSSDKQNQ